MTSGDARRRLEDIAAACRDAVLIVSAGRRRFDGDPIEVRAAKNIVSEIGEAAKGVPDDVLAGMPGVPWRAVKGMRDKVVHDYPEVDLDVLWTTLSDAIPQLELVVSARLRAWDAP